MNRLQMRDRLAACWSVEKEHLATVEARWRAGCRLGRRLRVKRACANVWHLLEGGAEPLRQ
eukprot:11353655-Alexandrium_andersonii.AAC.1